MTTLQDRVTELRARAARFYAVDFHLHSPASHDWDEKRLQGTPPPSGLGKLAPGAPPPDASVRAFRAACIASRRDVVIVTDHNVARFGIAAAALNDSDLCVLPGIEMTVTIDQPILKDHKVHVVGVFPESVGAEAVGRVFPSGTPDDAQRTGTDEYVFESLAQVVTAIRDQGGFIVAAHIYNDRGYRCEYRRGVELVLEPMAGTPAESEVVKRFGDQVKPELEKFDCLQVKCTTEPRHFLSGDGDLRVTLVVGTDCHLSTELGAPAVDRCTHVKMSQPSFAGLRDAVRYPETRVRLNADLTQPPPPKLLGIRVYAAAAGDNTFFTDTTLGFSDNLNCIIGPRGSGKSAIIDAARYLFGLNRSLDDDRVSEQVRARQTHTLKGARIEALYELPGGVVHRLEATYDRDEDYVTRVYDAEGNLLNIQDIALGGGYPLSLYGWSELELLAGSAETQRELLDCFVPEVLTLKDKKRHLLETLRDNTRKMVDQTSSMERFFVRPELDFMRLREFEKGFEQLNTPEIQGVFRALDEIESKRALIRKARVALTGTKDSALALSGADPGALAAGTAHSEWLASLFAPPEGELSLADLVAGASESLGARVALVEERLNEEEARLTAEESEARKTIQTVAGDHAQIAGDLRNNAKQRMERATANLAEYETEHAALTALKEDRSSILDRVEDADRQISTARAKEAKSIADLIRLVEDKGFAVTLPLRVGADRSAFNGALTHTASREHFPGNYGQQKRIETIVENLTPREFVTAVLEADSAALNGDYTDQNGDVHAIEEAYAQQVIEVNSPATPLESFNVCRWDPMKLKWLLELEEAPCDDDFYVELGGRPIQHCSPGQRCSAMLPIVALTSAAPLVLDQPEDNLDNRLVSRTLFKILARLKETRQIIVSTHNPNILVSGDAEQVLVLGPDGKLEEAGSIDRDEVIEHVISLMEGGAKAFQKRRRRYRAFIVD